ASVGAAKPCARDAIWPAKVLRPAAWAVASGPVAAFDAYLFGGRAAGEAFVVAGAVGLLRRGVDLVQEPGAGALDRERDPVNRNGVYSDALHCTPFWRQRCLSLPTRPSADLPTLWGGEFLLAYSTVTDLA